MKRLYFVRHGESLINIRDVFASKPGAVNDLGLTELGRQQALQEGKTVAERKLQVDVMVASPSARALETAKIIAREIGYPESAIQISDLLVELQFGELEGTPWNIYWESGHTYKDLGDYRGAETIEAMQNRADKALEYLRSLPQDNVLVVSHSAFGRALRRAVEGTPYPDEFENNISLPYGEVLQLI